MFSDHRLISDVELRSGTGGELRSGTSTELRSGAGVELNRLHSRAMTAAAGFRRAEGELMEALIAVDRAKVHHHLGYASLFQYAVSALGLSEAVAYAAISVARKAESVPALREAVAAGAIGFSKARKVVAVLDRAQPAELQSKWVEKAVSLSSRKLERAVAQANPRAGISERAVYKSERRIELTLGVSEALMLEFRAAQDLVSSARGNAATLEETLAQVVEFYLSRKDPERRARRVIAKKGSTGVSEAGKAAEASTVQDPAGPSNGTVPPSIGSLAATIDSADRNHAPARLEEEETPIQASSGQIEPADKASESPEQNPRPLLFTGTVGVRKPVPAATLHAVRIRDRNSCQAIQPDGRKCGSKRWLEVHHRRPVCEGGTNELGNLVTYCQAHHAIEHLRLKKRLILARSSSSFECEGGDDSRCGSALRRPLGPTNSSARPLRRASLPKAG